MKRSASASYSLSDISHGHRTGHAWTEASGDSGHRLEDARLDPIGTAASHGRIRIDNGPITWMAHHLPAGTPVMITG